MTSASGCATKEGKVSRKCSSRPLQVVMMENFTAITSSKPNGQPMGLPVLLDRALRVELELYFHLHVRARRMHRVFGQGVIQLADLLITIASRDADRVRRLN